MLLAVLIAALVSSCGGPPPTAPLLITVPNNDLLFDKAQLSVPAGSKVTLTLRNNASVPELAHNWVLIKAGTEDSVAAAGELAGEGQGWIPKGDSDVLAALKPVSGGQTGSITFDAPPPGTYDFLCTFPPHTRTMRGTFTVTAATTQSAPVAPSFGRGR